MCEKNFPKEIHLRPEEWLWAGWRGWHPLEKPRAKKFDQKQARIRMTRYSVDKFQHHTLKNLTSEEALYWARAFQHADELVDVQLQHSPQKMEKLINYDPDMPLTESEAEALFASEEAVERSTLQVIIPLFGPVKAVEFLVHASLKFDSDKPWKDWRKKHVINFREDCLIYLTAVERSAAAATLKSMLKSDDVHDDVCVSRFVAALAGLCGHWDESYIQEFWGGLINSKSDSWLNKEEGKLLGFFLTGAPDGKIFSRNIRQLIGPKHYFTNWSPYQSFFSYETNRPNHDLAAWIAHTSDDELDFVLEALAVTEEISWPEIAFPLFEGIETDKGALIMFYLTQQKGLGKKAMAWLKNNPALAIKGGFPLLANLDEEIGLIAKGFFLKQMKKPDQKAMIERVAADHPDGDQLLAAIAPKEAGKALETETPQWLQKAMTSVENRGKCVWPPFLDYETLPVLTTEGEALSKRHLRALLVSLQRSKPDKPHANVKAYKEHVPQKELVRLAERLFREWQRLGENTDTKWLIYPAGFFGAKSCLVTIQQQIPRWNREWMSHLVMDGLKSIRAWGTPEALDMLTEMAEEVHGKSLKKKIDDILREAASDQGLTRELMEERMVPDYGFTSEGRRFLDFGPRQFEIVFEAASTPRLRDSHGKILKSLPKPTKSDVETIAKASKETWKTLRKELMKALKQQGQRLENQLVLQQVRPFKILQEAIDHPLLRHPARTLVWVALDEEGAYLLTFRIDEDGSYLNIEEEPVTIANAARITIAHPYHLPHDLLKQWGEIFADYEIMPPFPQIDRKVFRLTEKELKSKNISHWKDVKVAHILVGRRLEGRGWNRPSLWDEDAWYFYRRFPGTGFAVCVNIWGDAMRDPNNKENVTVGDAHFFPDKAVKTRGTADSKKKLKLSEVPPILISEAMRDLDFATAGDKIGTG